MCISYKHIIIWNSFRNEDVVQPGLELGWIRIPFKIHHQLLMSGCLWELSQPKTAQWSPIPILIGKQNLHPAWKRAYYCSCTLAYCQRAVAPYRPLCIPWFLAVTICDVPYVWRLIQCNTSGLTKIYKKSCNQITFVYDKLGLKYINSPWPFRLDYTFVWPVSSLQSQD